MRKPSPCIKCGKVGNEAVCPCAPVVVNGNAKCAHCANLVKHHYCANGAWFPFYPACPPVGVLAAA